ncbi:MULTISPECIES: hypothetical protein [Methanosarcina]|nr:MULTISPECIES: hypothetical protein [Methanosarcina]MDO5840518.1 hypothetical protein [Methanosarcina mazei]WIM42381.1 hypothetical protein PSF70_12790 [Methanosarcina mazei]
MGFLEPDVHRRGNKGNNAYTPGVRIQPCRGSLSHFASQLIF